MNPKMTKEAKVTSPFLAGESSSSGGMSPSSSTIMTLEEKVFVLAHHLDDGLGILLRHAALHVQLHHLALLALRVIIQLPLLALVLRARVLELRLAAEVIAEAHREPVRDQVGESHEEDHVGAQGPADRGCDDGEGGDDAVQTAENETLDVLAGVAARVRGGEGRCQRARR